MRKIITLLTAIVLFATSLFAQSTETDLVKKAFDNYKSAILNDQGEEAVKHVDSKTLNYYAYILDAIKHADSSKLTSLPIVDKLTIFAIRHRATKEEILSMNGNDVFVYAIKKGMVGKNSVANTTIGTVTIDKNSAKGQFVLNKEPIPLYFHFNKEGDRWKVDLTSLFPVSNTGLKNAAKQSGQNENEYIFGLLEMLTGKKPGPEIWSTLK